MINKTILIGQVSSEPQVSSFSNGAKVANFILTTTETWKDSKTGLDKSRSDRHKIAVFYDRLADFVKNHVHKNTLLYIEGQLENRTYVDSLGNQQGSYDIVIRPVKGSIIILGDGDDDEQFRFASL